MLRDKKTAVKKWVVMCNEALQAELKHCKCIEETELYASILTVIDKKEVDTFLDHNLLLDDLFTRYGEKLHRIGVMADELGKKYNNYDFIIDYTPVLGHKKVFEIGLNVAKDLNKNIEIANNPIVKKVPEEDIEKLVAFFEEKSNELPQSNETLDVFKVSFLAQILCEVSK